MATNGKMTTDALATKLKAIGLELYRERSGYPLSQAQRNLEGRTHYVDDKSIKFHAAKIISCNVLDDGLILGIVESVKAGFNEQESGRVYRPVFFDVFGNDIYRPDIENSFKTAKQANASFWAQAEMIDAIKATLEGAERKRNLIELELRDYDAFLKELRK